MADRHTGAGTDAGGPQVTGADTEATGDGRTRRQRGLLTGAVELPTPSGPARLDLDRPAGRVRGLLVLGHGAGGGVDAPDLLAVREAALAASVAVVRVTQPYRLRGRRAPAPAPQLDQAWVAVVSALRAPEPGLGGFTVPPRVPLIVGGRSSGARVACRTARALGAAGIVALAFPVHPPGRPDRSRAGELATGLPTLVVNGDRDPFGIPDEGPGLVVHRSPGDRHDLRRDPPAVGAAVIAWLARHGWATPSLDRTDPAPRGPSRTSGSATSQAHPGPGGARHRPPGPGRPGRRTVPPE